MLSGQSDGSPDKQPPVGSQKAHDPPPAVLPGGSAPPGHDAFYSISAVFLPLMKAFLFLIRNFMDRIFIPDNTVPNNNPHYFYIYSGMIKLSELFSLQKQNHWLWYHYE